MTQGMHAVRDKLKKNVRISHAKAFALLKGELIVSHNLPPELAQGISNAPGEINDDSKSAPPEA